MLIIESSWRQKWRTSQKRERFFKTVPFTKADQAEAKKLWAAEKKKPENGKAFGQPANAKMDGTLKKNETDRAAQFGGIIEGSRARAPP
jgi:hypothetical protein